MPKYLRSEWSVAQFHVQEDLRHIVGFGQQENTISIVGYDGRYEFMNAFVFVIVGSNSA